MRYEGVYREMQIWARGQSLRKYLGKLNTFTDSNKQSHDKV